MGEEKQTVEAGAEAQAEFGQLTRDVAMAQARAEVALANMRAAEAQRYAVALKEMAAQGLKPSAWSPMATPEGRLTFVKIEVKVSKAAGT